MANSAFKTTFVAAMSAVLVLTSFALIPRIVDADPQQETGGEVFVVGKSEHVNLPTRVVKSIGNAKLILIDNVEVATRDGGIVTGMMIAEGDVVTRDQTLISLDSRAFEAEYEAAMQQRVIAEKESRNEVDREYAEKSARVNEQVYNRAVQANKDYQRSISRTEVERLKLELERACLSLKQAEHTKAVNELTTDLRRAQEKLAQVNLDNREIRSPIDGQVVQVFVQQGEFAAPGQPVARVIRTNRLRVETYIDDEVAFKMKKGQRAEFVFTREDEDYSAPGEIVFVSPEIDPANLDVRVLVEIDNPDGLFRPGMLGDLHILDPESPGNGLPGIIGPETSEKDTTTSR